jgi:hypothetical protein
MKPSLVAGVVRGRLLLTRRIAPERARTLAASASLGDAVAGLAGSTYGPALAVESTLRGAQRGVLATALWDLRILAGWLPPSLAETMRVAASWFELANVEDRLAAFQGASVPPPFRLGTLSTAPRAASAASPEDLRAALTSSAWGDPGGADAEHILPAMRAAWARRALEHAPEASSWILGQVAVALALWRFLPGASDRPLPPVSRILGGPPSRWESPADLDTLVASLPSQASWALAGVHTPDHLWIAENTWWRRVQRDAERLVRHGSGRGAVVGAVTLLLLDARLVCGALEQAAAGRSYAGASGA